MKNQAGFTLFELLIAVSLTILLLLSASSLFMMFLIGNTKISGGKLVKAEGNYALSQMEFLLRNAIELLPNADDQQCELDMTEIRLKSIDGGITSLFGETDSGVDKIASNSGVYLTSGSVELVTGPEFDCTQSDDETNPHITISFTLRKGTPGVDKPRDIIEETFTSSTNLRSF